MKKIATALALALAVSAFAAAEEPIGVTLSTELDSGDFFATDFGLSLATTAEVGFGDSGFLAGVTAYTDFLPSFSVISSLDVYEEYDFTAAEIDFAVSNTNNIAFADPIAVTGTLELDATWKFVNGGLDFDYLNGFAFTLYAGPTGSFEVGPGTLNLSATAYLPVYPTFGLGDIEGTLEYELPVEPWTFTFGLTPVVTQPWAFGLSAYAGAEIAF